MHLVVVVFFLISYNIHEKEEVAHPGQNKEGQRAQNMGTWATRNGQEQRGLKAKWRTV